MEHPEIIGSSSQSMDPNGRESKRKRSAIEEPRIRTMEIVKGMENDEELVVIDKNYFSTDSKHWRQKSKDSNRMLQPSYKKQYRLHKRADVRL